MTAHVIEASAPAVHEGADPFTHLAAGLTPETRATLAEAVASGAYAEAAAEVDAAEEESDR